MSNRVEIQIDGHVAEVSLCRPGKYNALDRETFEQLTAAGETLKGNDQIRAVVLRGEGDNFCSGLDVSSLGDAFTSNADFAKAALSPGEGQVANFYQKPAYVWKELQVPVIAALQGVVFGGGCQIALGADIRIASADVRMSVMEIKWGLIPDMSITQTLPRLVAMDVAMDLVLTGRIVEAAEAKALGLITRIADDPLAAAREAAQQIAAKSPDATRRGKQLLEQAWLMNPADGLRLEAALQAEILAMPNQLEAVAANLQKREPKFS